MIFLSIGSHFTQAGSFAGQHINIVQRHRIQKRLAGGNAAGKHRFVSLLIVFIRIFNNQSGCILKQFLPVLMRSHNRAVTRKRQSYCFIQAVHGVGGEHARTTSASGTCVLFDLGNFLIAHAFVSRLNHGINQVEVLPVPFSGFHRATRNEHRRDVQPHRRHEHTRSDLIAIADADHGIRLMGIHHVLHTVGNDVARRQGIQHTVMPHCNAVVDGNRIEFGGEAALLFYLFLYELTYFMQMHMPRNKLSKRIDYCNDGLSHLFFLHAIGRPQCTSACHAAALRAERTA